MKSRKNHKPFSNNTLTPNKSVDLSPRPFHNIKDHNSEVDKGNQIGLPFRLKAGIEHLSGVSLDDVRVHYNSDKPASVGASAYAQGTQIHVGPGQEHTLPHEAWHAVQQKQGRVKVTRKANNKGVNDDPDLETEASAMGYLAGGNETRVHLGNTSKQAEKVSKPQRPTSLINGSQVIQLTKEDDKDGPILYRKQKEDFGKGPMLYNKQTVLADKPVFDWTTKVADAATLAGSGIRAVDKIGAGASAAMGIASALPLVGATTGAIGLVENPVRGVAALKRANIMGRQAQYADGERARNILKMGQAEQSREVKRRVIRTIGGSIQTGLMIGGIGAGVATGGAGLVAAATVLGGMKATETLYNLYRKRKGKKLSDLHAQQLLFAAQAGDKGVLGALRDLGVQTKNLEKPEVWKKATKKLSPLMSKANSVFSNIDLDEPPNDGRRGAISEGGVEANQEMMRNKMMQNKKIGDDPVAIERLKRREELQRLQRPNPQP